MPTFGRPDERDRGRRVVARRGEHGVPAGRLGLVRPRRPRRRPRRPPGPRARRRRRRTARAGRRRRRPRRRPPRRSRAFRASSAGLSGGRASTISSRRSATPRPCDAAIVKVRSQPSDQNSAASSSRLSLSVLLTATKTGAFATRRSSAASWSAGVRPAMASTTKTMTSASAIARRAWTWTLASIASSGAASRPPVSTMTKRRPFHSVSPYRRSRVVRARSSTIAVRSPTIRLKSVLFPTFGRPTMATTGSPVRRALRPRRSVESRRRVAATRTAGRRSAGRSRGERERGIGELAGAGPRGRRAGELQDPLCDGVEVLDRAWTCRR